MTTPAQVTARRRRIVILAAANLVLAVAIAVGLWLTEPILSARFDPGFPADLVVVRNLGSRPMDAVVLTLDGRYVHRLGHLPAGPQVPVVLDEFVDQGSYSPVEGYVPHRLEVRHAGGVEAVLIEADR